MLYWTLSPIYFDPASTLLSRSSFSVVLFAASLSLRDLSERLSLTGASRESVRIWVHRFSSIFRPSRRKRRLVAVDEAVLKVTRSDLLP
jgi:transposase-like protein